LDKDKKENPAKFYAKYSSLAFQMIAIILAGAFGGRALDRWIEWVFPVFTLSLTILAAVVATIYGMRELFKQK
jgi:ATP synthase protein I